MKGIQRKHSGKRDEILRAIQSTESHPGAQWVYDTLKPLIPGLSLGTVYRNINLFRQEGKIISVGVVAGEERFDGRAEPHPHFVCESCGAVIDLGEPIQSEISANNSIETPDFTIDKRKTMFYGICKDCSASRACSESCSCTASQAIPAGTPALD
jgi:Fur family peroxide stress response transcriptional regulator